MSLRSIPLTAGWGLLAACSWTWCIGMYLPVILLREFGWPGFLVFAVPNVLGCAAFGYAWRRRDLAERAVNEHAPAMVLFSIVAIAFHLFFAGYLLQMLRPDAGPLPAVLAGIALWAVGLGVSFLPDRGWLPLALLAYAVSITLFQRYGTAGLESVQWSGAQGPLDLAALGPAIAIGFLLCPYLDLTFYRARLESPSRHAFLVFGVTFAPMLLFTAAYAADLSGLVVAHVAVQSVFTVALHLREMRRAPRPAAPAVKGVAAAIPLPGALAVLLPVAAEDTYLRFLGPYALLFPAYVLAFMMLRLRRTPGTAALFLLAVAVLAPCYEAAFVHGVTWPALIPAALLIAAGLAAVTEHR